MHRDCARLERLAGAEEYCIEVYSDRISKNVMLGDRPMTACLDKIRCFDGKQQAL